MIPNLMNLDECVPLALLLLHGCHGTKGIVVALTVSFVSRHQQRTNLYSSTFNRCTSFMHYTCFCAKLDITTVSAAATLGRLFPFLWRYAKGNLRQSRGHLAHLFLCILRPSNYIAALALRAKKKQSFYDPGSAILMLC